MKKELFDQLVRNILAQPGLFSTYKVTIKEGLEVHTFGNIRNKDLAEAKTLFKEKGYKMEDVHYDAGILAAKNKLVNYYLTILYGADKDKISISTFETGYALALRKSRYYPLKRNCPVLTYTKHMYSFVRVKGQSKPGVRIHKANIYIPGFSAELSDLMTKTLMKVDYIPQARISYRHFINTKSDLQALSNMFEVKVPDALKRFPINDVVALYKTIKDFNQINKLCQFIAKGDIFESKDDFVTGRHLMSVELSLHGIIARMLFGDHTQRYLIHDSIADCLVLKKRGISFAVTSQKRWQQEHQTMTKLRMLKGVPEIKVEEIYKKALEGIEYPCELIKSKDRLVAESVELHHCVATYAEKINRGDCAIFSIDFEGKRYTLEVAAKKFKEGIFYMPVQFRGLANCSAPDLIGKRVAEILHTNSTHKPHEITGQLLVTQHIEPEMQELNF